MHQSPTISDAEWHVMHVLWEQSPRTAVDVVDALAPKHDWHDRTIKTMLNRLVKKGALSFAKEGKRYLYEPAISRDQAVRDQVHSLRDRVFEGAAAPMLTYLVKQKNLSKDELTELKRILDEQGANS